jgi:hypothetical protein
MIFVMVKCGVLYKVQTELLTIIKTRAGFKGLSCYILTNLLNYTEFTLT